MFLEGLRPIFKELLEQPVAFLGGFCSGVLRLDLSEDPVRSWLDRQADLTPAAGSSDAHNGKSEGPTTITIE
jgi:hypothetical protein